MIIRESDTPYFKQLQAIIESDIRNGIYKIGDKLPSESEFCERYNVSRTTVRQALNLLLQKDLVYSVHGKGTFVKLPELKHELSKVVSFSNVLQTSGLDGLTRVLSYDTGVTNPSATEHLGTDYFNLFMMGFAKNSPIVYYESFVSNKYKSAVYAEAKKMEIAQMAFSTYDIYRRIGVKIDQIHQRLHAISADSRLAALFCQPSRPPVLIKLDSVYYDVNGEIIECKVAYYRADMYSFELNREPD